MIVVCSCLVALVAAAPQIIAEQIHTDYFTDEDIVGSPAGSNWAIAGNQIPTMMYFDDCSGNRIFGGF